MYTKMGNFLKHKDILLVTGVTMSSKQKTLWQCKIPELYLIKDEQLRKTAWNFLCAHAPKEFWTRESSRKHHPLDERAKGGLLLHTRRVMKLASAVAEAVFPENSPFHDYFVAAAMLHDIFQGEKSHPEKAADLICNSSEFPLPKEIANLVRYHMGRWGISTSTEIPHVLFHVVDYIASREWVKIDV